MLNNQQDENTNEDVAYLGNVGLSKEQVQGILAQYLGTNNEELKGAISDAEKSEKDIRFKAIWLTDSNFCEVHFTAVEDNVEDLVTTNEIEKTPEE